jgi:hypothetical protein
MLVDLDLSDNTMYVSTHEMIRMFALHTNLLLLNLDSNLLTNDDCRALVHNFLDRGTTLVCLSLHENPGEGVVYRLPGDAMEMCIAEHVIQRTNAAAEDAANKQVCEELADARDVDEELVRGVMDMTVGLRLNFS